MTIEFSQLMQVLGFAVSIGAAVFSWLSKKDGATASQLREIEQRQQASDARVLTIETRMQNVPNMDAIHRLELRMQEVNGKFDQVNGKFDGLSDQFATAMRGINRLEEFLLNNANNAAASQPKPARAQGRK